LIRGAGDRRPLHRPEGRSLGYARLLCHALVDDKSEMGAKFNSERRALFLRWERLIKVLLRHRVHGYGQPPAELDAVEKWLDQAVVGDSVYYPKLRELSAIAQAEIERRQTIVEEETQKFYEWLKAEYGVYVGSSDCVEAERAWKAEVRRLNLWVREVQNQENPESKMRRSRHPMLRRYRREVEAFCIRWYLNAWWAVPVIVRSHFDRLELETDGLMPINVVTFDVRPYRIFAKLPGATDEEFERDRARFEDAAMTSVAKAPPGLDDITVTWQPTREQMAAAEREADAAVVVIDWTGDSYPSKSEPTELVSLTEHIIEECSARLGRPLTKRARREVLRLLKPQVANGRRWFHEQGWVTMGAADLERTAKWVASRLLDPSRPWSEITRIDSDDFAGVTADLLRPRMKACTTFAKHAELALPRSVAQV